MPFNCPVAPANPDLSLLLQTTIVLAGTELIRFYSKSKKYPADSFNPNTGKRIGVEEDGARFNPFPGAPLPNVPTMYAADSLPAAALESVFHNVDHSPSPSFPKMQLADWQYSRLKVMRKLLVLKLTNPHLRQLAVPGRATSIEEGELIHSPTSEYPNTRTWARFLHGSLPTLDGLAWRPRLAGTGWSYVLFGDRFVAGDLKAESTPTSVTQVWDTLRSSKLPSRPASESSDPNKTDESKLSSTSLFPLRRRHKDDKTLGSANDKLRFLWRRRNSVLVMRSGFDLGHIQWLNSLRPNCQDDVMFFIFPSINRKRSLMSYQSERWQVYQLGYRFDLEGRLRVCR